MLGCELWVENLDSLFALVKEYIINLWEARKIELYGEPCSTQLQSQSSTGDLRDGTVGIPLTHATGFQWDLYPGSQGGFLPVNGVVLK